MTPIPNHDPQSNPASHATPRLKIFGVGSAGIAVLEQLIQSSLPDVEFVAVGTDDKSLSSSTAPAKLHLENKLLRGLGSGGDPARAPAIPEESANKIKSLCDGAAVVLVIAGFGGGAGTGISPVIARIARESGALALAFVTTPFDCEGRRRQALAQEGLDQLKEAAD